MVNNEGTKIIKEDLLVGVIVFGGFIDQVYLDEDLQSLSSKLLEILEEEGFDPFEDDAKILDQQQNILWRYSDRDCQRGPCAECMFYAAKLCIESDMDPSTRDINFDNVNKKGSFNSGITYKTSKNTLVGRVDNIKKLDNGQYAPFVCVNGMHYRASEELLKYNTKVGDSVLGYLKNQIFVITKVADFEYVHGPGSSLKSPK